MSDLFTGKDFYIDKDNYKYVKFDANKHKKFQSMFTRNYVPEHRLVFAKKIGRPLLSKEHIHHKDKNRLNNSISNLYVVDIKRHLKGHIRDGSIKLFSTEYQPRWRKKASYNPKQIAMGMKVEREHDDITKGKKELVRKIVNAHLKELPDYYTRLKKMESEKQASRLGWVSSGAGLGASIPLAVYLLKRKNIDKDKRKDILKGVIKNSLLAAIAGGTVGNIGSGLAPVKGSKNTKIDNIFKNITKKPQVLKALKIQLPLYMGGGSLLGAGYHTLNKKDGDEENGKLLRNVGAGTGLGAALFAGNLLNSLK